MDIEILYVSQTDIHGASCDIAQLLIDMNDCLVACDVFFSILGNRIKYETQHSKNVIHIHLQFHWTKMHIKAWHPYHVVLEGKESNQSTKERLMSAIFIHEESKQLQSNGLPVGRTNISSQRVEQVSHHTASNSNRVFPCYEE